MADKTEIGKRLSKARAEAGYTQGELANLIPCSQNFVSLLETGKRTLKSDIAVKVSEILGVRADWLLGLTDYASYDEEFSQLLDKEVHELDIMLSFLRTILGRHGYRFRSSCGPDTEFQDMCFFKSKDGAEQTVSMELVLSVLLNDIEKYTLFRTKDFLSNQDRYAIPKCKSLLDVPNTVKENIVSERKAEEYGLNNA